MSTRQDSDGDTPKSRSQRNQRRNHQPDLPQPQRQQTSLMESQGLLLANQLGFFFAHDDGYLKIKREPDGEDIHLTWIWTMGKWTRHYIYVRIAYFEVAYGLDLLQGKLLQVEEGRRHPTPDRFQR